MQTTPKLRQTAFSPSKVVVATVAGLFIAGAASWFYHPLMVRLNGGNWCAKEHYDGRATEFLYEYGCGW